MVAYEIQENGFRGNIKPTVRHRCAFYNYSLWRTGSGEHLFDGSAGDLSEAVETVRACIRFLSAQEMQASNSAKPTTWDSNASQLSPSELPLCQPDWNREGLPFTQQGAS
jgi:hypothetical protein